MLPQRLAAQVFPNRPIENDLGGVREMSLAVRVIRLVHQHTWPENVDHRLGHGGALEGLGTTTEAAHLDIFYWLALERRSGTRDIADHLAQSDHPVWQPAVADLSDAGVDIWVLVENLPDNEVGEEPRRTPGMGGRASHHRVAPDVAIAREIGWLVEKAMEEDRQVGVVHHVPKWPQVRMVDRFALGQQGPDRRHPRLVL